MKLLDTRTAGLKFGWRFPTPTASLEFVVELSTPVPAKGLVALVSLPEGASIASDSWGFSKSLAGHYHYIDLEHPGCLALPGLALDQEISSVKLSILPWGTKQVVPRTAVAGAWSIGAFNQPGTHGLSAILKGNLLTND